MAEDKPPPVELPALALKQAQRRALWVQATNDRFGALVITRQANRGMTHFHPFSTFDGTPVIVVMGARAPERKNPARHAV